MGLRCFILFAVVGWLATTRAWAHRDRGPDDPCRRQIGDSLLHITLYQPQFDPVAEYCENVPRAGTTTIVVDFTAGELRETPVSVEVIETSLTGESLAVVTLPAKAYEFGSIAAEAVLKDDRDYRVRVLLGLKGQDRPNELVFPFRVSVWYRALLMPALLVIGLLALMAISVIRYLATARQNDSMAVLPSRQSNRFA